MRSFRHYQLTVILTEKTPTEITWIPAVLVSYHGLLRYDFVMCHSNEFVPYGITFTIKREVRAVAMKPRDTSCLLSFFRRFFTAHARNRHISKSAYNLM